MDSIGQDCENIILDYKAQLDHRDNFKKCLDYISRTFFEYHESHYGDCIHVVKYIDRKRFGYAKHKIKDYRICNRCKKISSYYYNHICD